MTSIAYVNGRYRPVSQATVSIIDRGYLFADGVYEVCAVLNGAIVDGDDHWTRLRRSLDGLGIDPPVATGVLDRIVRETLRRNHVRDGLAYVQVTRGVAPRDHAFPEPPPRPALVVTAKRFDFRQRIVQQATGVHVITLPDQRWKRVDLKTIGLLPNVLGKQAAREAGAFECWFVDVAGAITEGSSTNAWMVSTTGALVTRPAGPDILSGVMRSTVLRVARTAGLLIEERGFTPDEACSAPEAFLTSTTAPCLPVIAIDGRPVGAGKPGPVSGQVAALLWQDIARQTGWTAY